MNKQQIKINGDKEVIEMYHSIILESGLINASEVSKIEKIVKYTTFYEFIFSESEELITYLRRNYWYSECPCSKNGSRWNECITFGIKKQKSRSGIEIKKVKRATMKDFA